MKQFMRNDLDDARPLSAGLTPREQEVLLWLATGKTDGDIATLLDISRRTVQKHLEHIYVKLGVETRTAAVMRGVIKGSVRPTDATSAM